jgi:GDP-D-mannose 3', 5'-epimerase
MSSEKAVEVKKALVLGGGGFIGGHLVKKLKTQNYWVRSVDLKPHQYGADPDEFILGDLTDKSVVNAVIDLGRHKSFDEIYQLAADMGGAGYIFSGENDANVMYNSSLINLNLLNAIRLRSFESLHSLPTIFYSSSACVYPEDKQLSPETPGLREIDAYPANPDSEYGWEKLFSERLYLSFARNFGIPIRIARFHNIFGPEGTWIGGREKAPAAICRKVIEATNPGTIEIWGDGEQTRSFLYVDECLEAVSQLMSSNYMHPVNIGSEEKISINQLVVMASSYESKEIVIKHIDGPLGVRGRNSDNDIFRQVTGWQYKKSLSEGLKETYFWIKRQVEDSPKSSAPTSNKEIL